ncbi:MAG: alpha/beta hydrolase [Acidiferrobacterales bacterium]|nr:alpha/beta hydrolase [Acidiferrobacterales bacterium]
MYVISPIKARRGAVRARLMGMVLVCLLSGKTAMADTDPPGQFIKVNGHQVHLHCTGAGSPVVVLEAGLGGFSLEWAGVQNQLSQFTRVCSYDRPGYGWSELSTAPRNAKTIARDLHTLLSESGESGPYVMVGHSLGGHIIRLFAHEHADEVASLVLVDASHENMFQFLQKRPRHARERKARTITRRSEIAPRLPKNFPPQFESVALNHLNRFETRFAIQNEMRQFRRSADEVRAISSLPGVPVTVISRSPLAIAASGETGLIAAKWSEMQMDLQKRLGNSDHVIAIDSGHYPHLDQPELVTTTILSQVNNLTQNRLSKL